MTRWLRTRDLVAALIAAAGLSACVQALPIPGAGGVSDGERQQAQEALTRWAAAVEVAGGDQGFVPVGELTGQVGDWEVEVGDNNKPALYAGLLVPIAKLSTETPAAAKIRWDDGRTKTVRPMSAIAALEALKAAGDHSCSECAPLQVTGARLSTVTIQTSRGPATAPAWLFTLKGTKVVATRIAVATADAVVVTPPPWDSNNSPAGLHIDSATAAVDGRQLTVAFTGAPDVADKPCGADYSAEAVESDSAVVVITHPNGAAVACSAIGATRTATATLTRPLGERTVLEVTQGLPVSVVVTP